MKLNKIAGSVEAFREAFPYSGLEDSVVSKLVDSVKAMGMGELEVGDAALAEMRTTALNRNANWRLATEWDYQRGRGNKGVDSILGYNEKRARN